MPPPAVTYVEPPCVDAVQKLHRARELVGSRVDNQVIMSVHEDERNATDTTAREDRRGEVDELLPVLVCQIKVLPVNASSRDVEVPVREIVTSNPRHSSTVPADPVRRGHLHGISTKSAHSGLEFRAENGARHECGARHSGGDTELRRPSGRRGAGALWNLTSTAQAAPAAAAITA